LYVLADLNTDAVLKSNFELQLQMRNFVFYLSTSFRPELRSDR